MQQESNQSDAAERSVPSEPGISHWVAVEEDGIIEVVGPDAGKLLQGQLTADVLALESGDSTPAALCNPQGRVLGVFKLVRHEQGFWLRLPLDNMPIVLETLRKYAVFFKVEIKHQQEMSILLRASAEVPPDVPWLCAALPLANGMTEIWVRRIEPVSFFKDAAVSQDQKIWQFAKIANGQVSIHEHTAGEFLPHALSLDLAGAISFKKGCYTGQEIIARTEYRGRSKRRLLYLLIDTEGLKAGDSLTNKDGGPVGTVVNAVSIDGQSHVLASFADPMPTDLLLHCDAKAINMSVLPLPWNDGHA